MLSADHLWSRVGKSFQSASGNLRSAIEKLESEKDTADTKDRIIPSNTLSDVQIELDIYKKLLDDAHMGQHELSQKLKILIAEKDAEVTFWRRKNGVEDSTPALNERDLQVLSLDRIRAHSSCLEESLLSMSGQLKEALRGSNEMKALTLRCEDSTDRYHVLNDEFSRYIAEAEAREREQSMMIETLKAASGSNTAVPLPSPSSPSSPIPSAVANTKLLEQQLDELHQAKQALENDHLNLKSEYAALQNEVNELQNELNQLQRESIEDGMKMTKVTADMAKVTDEFDLLKEHMNEVGHQLKDKSEAFLVLSQKHDALVDAKRVADIEMVRLEDQLQSKGAELESQLNEKNNLTERLNESSERVGDLTERVSALTECVSVLTERESELQREVELQRAGGDKSTSILAAQHAETKASLEGTIAGDSPPPSYIHLLLRPYPSSFLTHVHPTLSSHTSTELNVQVSELQDQLRVSSDNHSHLSQQLVAATEAHNTAQDAERQRLNDLHSAAMGAERQRLDLLHAEALATAIAAAAMERESSLTRASSDQQTSMITAHQEAIAALEVTHQQAIIELQTAIETMKASQASHQDSIAALENAHKGAISEMEATHQETISELQATIETIKASQATIEASHQEEISALEVTHQQAISVLETAHQSKISELQSNVETMKASQATNDASHQEAIAILETTHQQTISELQSAHQKETSTLETTHQEAISELQSTIETIKASQASIAASHQEAISALESTHKQAISALEAGHKQAISTVETACSERIGALETNHQETIRTMESTHDTVVQQKHTQHTIEIEQLQQQHANETEKLQQQHTIETEKAKEEHAVALTQVTPLGPIPNILPHRRVFYYRGTNDVRVISLSTHYHYYHSDINSSLIDYYNDVIAGGDAAGRCLGSTRT